jgi:hypothetical protein
MKAKGIDAICNMSTLFLLRLLFFLGKLKINNEKVNE